MARISGEEVNQALGAFFQTFSAVKGLMEDRAHRLAWQEAQPQIEAQLQEQFTLLQTATQETQAAKTPEERAAAMDKQMGAMKQFSMGAMQTAARLAASGNPYAQKYGASLQETVGTALKQEFEGAKLQLDRQAQEQQAAIEEMKSNRETARQGVLDQRYEQGLQREAARDAVGDERWRTTQGQAAADRERDDTRANDALELEKRRVELAEKEAGQGDPLREAGKIAELLGQRQQLKQAGVEDSRLAPIEEALKAFGVKPDMTPELYSTDLERRRDQAKKARDIAKDPETRKMWEEELADIELDSADAVKAEAKRVRKSRQPGAFQKLLKELETPPGGMPRM